MELWYTSVIIPLSSSIGEELFHKSLHTAYDYLSPHFEIQEHISFCGIACACILLKSLVPHRNWNQSTLYTTIAQRYMYNGITLMNLSHVLEECGIQPVIHYCEGESKEEKFRKALRQSKHFLIINYLRQYQDKDSRYTHRGGHFALIAAYNQMTDHVLVLETNQKNFSHHWLPIKDLIQMMSTYDRTASKPRGYLIINHSK